MSAPRSLRLSPSGSRQPYASDLVDVTWFGARPDGRGDPSSAFARAAAFAVANGGSVYAPAGVYGDGTNWTFALPDGVELVGDGTDSVLVNAFVTQTGSAGAEIPFTAPAAKGATSISIPATGLTNAWLRISSCINMQSTDAGVDQLGHDAAAMGFFAEFVQVKQGNLATADLMGATEWAYSNTPGPSSGTFTTSVARVITFATGAIRRIAFRGKNTAQNHNVLLTFCKGFVLEEVYADSNDQTNQCVRGLYCLDVKVIASTLIGKKTTVPAGSTANMLVFLSSQGCTAEDCDLYNGNQGMDVDCIPNDATYRGGPSLFCGAINCRAYDNATEGFTSHFGCYGSFYSFCGVKGSPRGVRMRDRGSRAIGNRMVGASSAGIGLLIDNAAWWDVVVAANVIDGYLYNVQMTQSAAGYETLQGLLGCGSTIIRDNTCRGAGDHGIYLNVANTLASMCGPRLLDNEVNSPTNDAIRINAYFNGTVVRGNRINGIAAGGSAVRWGNNIARLHVADTFAFNVNAAGFGLRGPGTASFITDLVTFPTGEAAAQLYLGDLYTDAAVPFQSIIRNTAAYLAPRRHGFGAFSAGLNNTGPTVERDTFGIYQRLGASVGQTLLFDVRDEANAFTTHQAVMRTSAADPNTVLTGSIGDLAVSTNTGALWRKTSGTNTNTGWVTP